MIGLFNNTVQPKPTIPIKDQIYNLLVRLNMCENDIGSAQAKIEEIKFTTYCAKNTLVETSIQFKNAEDLFFNPMYLTANRCALPHSIDLVKYS